MCATKYQMYSLLASLSIWSDIPGGKTLIRQLCSAERVCMLLSVLLWALFALIKSWVWRAVFFKGSVFCGTPFLIWKNLRQSGGTFNVNFFNCRRKVLAYLLSINRPVIKIFGIPGKRQKYVSARCLYHTFSTFSMKRTGKKANHLLYLYPALFTSYFISRFRTHIFQQNKMDEHNEKENKNHICF